MDDWSQREIRRGIFDQGFEGKRGVHQAEHGGGRRISGTFCAYKMNCYGLCFLIHTLERNSGSYPLQLYKWKKKKKLLDIGISKQSSHLFPVFKSLSQEDKENNNVY